MPTEVVLNEIIRAATAGWHRRFSARCFASLLHVFGKSSVLRSNERLWIITSVNLLSLRDTDEVRGNVYDAIKSHFRGIVGATRRSRLGFFLVGGAHPTTVTVLRFTGLGSKCQAEGPPAESKGSTSIG